MSTVNKIERGREKAYLGKETTKLRVVREDNYIYYGREMESL